jgi:hypothetical protein
MEAYLEKKYYTLTKEDICFGLEFEEKRVCYFMYKEQHAESYEKDLPLIELDSKSERFKHDARYKTEEWVKSVASEIELSKFVFSLDCGEGMEDYRVKYLDKEDIEELGWPFIGKQMSKWDAFRIKDCVLEYSAKNNEVLIYKLSPYIALFQGVVKNKSRLRLVMEMLQL